MITIQLWIFTFSVQNCALSLLLNIILMSSSTTSFWSELSVQYFVSHVPPLTHDRGPCVLPTFRPLQSSDRILLAPPTVFRNRFMIQNFLFLLINHRLPKNYLVFMPSLWWQRILIRINCIITIHASCFKVYFFLNIYNFHSSSQEMSTQTSH